MTQGYSGSYGVNGTNFQTQPTTGKWISRNNLGEDGNGHPIYPAPREFELTWNLAHVNDVMQLLNAYNAVSNTGTSVFDLPKFGAPAYLFYSYSGCTVTEPELGEYYEEYITDVRMTILLIRA